MLVDHPLEVLSLYSVGVEEGNSLLTNVVCTNDYSDSGFRSKFTGIKKVYLTFDVDGDFKDFLQSLDIEVYTIHRNTFVGSFFELLQNTPKKAVETISKIFSVPSLVSAPQAAVAAQTTVNKGYTVSYDDVLGHHYVTFPDRSYRVTGLFKNKGCEKLKVRLRVWINEEDILKYDDVLDLCANKQRVKYAKAASEDLLCDEKDLKKEINRLFGIVEQLQVERLTRPLSTKVEISPKDREGAETYLSQPNLIDVLEEDLKVMGVVGETGICAYLCGVSRLMERPLTVIAENKDLVDRVLPLFPTESVRSHTSISDKALYYEGSKQIKNQIFSVPFIKSKSSICQLIKGGNISQLTAVKDTETGGVKTKDFSLSCRPMVFMTDTDDVELKDQSVILKAGVSVKPTATTLELIAQQRKQVELVNKHQNIQRVLEPYVVVNPFVDQLDVVANCNLQQYLQLIESVTLLHQFQREVKTFKDGDLVLNYIETTLEDIEVANRVSKVVFRKSTLHEISVSLRNTFNVCADLVSKSGENWEKSKFTRKDILATGLLKQTTVGNHLKKLEKYDFITRVEGQNGVLMEYRLLVDPSVRDGVEPSLFDPRSVAA